MDRKAMKARAKRTLKRHYWLLVVVCLFAAFLGSENTASLSATSYQDDAAITGTSHLESMLGDIAAGDEDVVRSEVAQREQDIHDHDTSAMFARSRGVFAMVVNSFSSGSILLTITDAIRSILNSYDAAVVLMILGSLALYIFIWLFLQETYLIVSRRMTLEARVYDKVPLRRFLYPIQTGTWARMAWTMFMQTVYLMLWMFTVVGFVVKLFSYFLVPYIMAENPTMKANEAITLSRRMMRGHKWECFVAELSFLGWHVLSALTFGLVGIFYLNGYRAAFFAEYYARLRTLAKEQGIEGTERLCDDALFAKPDPAMVRHVYADAVDVIRQVENDAPVSKPTGFAGFLSEWFGIMLRRDTAVDAWQRHQARLAAVEEEKDVIAVRTYPERLAPATMRFRAGTVSGPGVTRSYTVLNLVMMFFIFCFVGWVWEVIIAFINEGMFVNRGTLHGPWLPIYGTGGLIILILLKKLRTMPALEFVAAMVLCGALEYFSSWYLEITHDGQRWWDYTGYFLNLNGRICAEGLLAFGLGGLAIVYLLAPALDDLLNRANTRALAVAAVVLLVAYCCDQAYSSAHPNTGAGVTDYRAAAITSDPTGMRTADAVSMSGATDGLSDGA